MPPHDGDHHSPPALSSGARITILAVAFLGWFFGGVQIGMTNLIEGAAVALLDQAGWAEGLDEAESSRAIDTWFAWLQCGFLFGAAAGGYLFGKLGDRIGRTRALGISIIWFSALTGLAYFAANPLQLLIIRFLACLGVGGCWPNGVALVSEAWAKVARPVMASLIGLAGNLGIFAFSTLKAYVAKNPEAVGDLGFRWVFLAGATAAPLGIVILLFVKESPAWLAARHALENGDGDASSPSTPSVFRKPYLGVTLVGIALATVPLFGGWGSFSWILRWAENPELKANILQTRSVMSIVGSGLAAVIALKIGRRTTYFGSALAALLVSQYIFWFAAPADGNFLLWVALWGFFNGIFFGWLPFFLPELFETKIRATGAGVSFNYGRILTASFIFLTPALMQIFDSNHQHVGRVTSLVFLFGMIAILFAPDTSGKNMEE